MNKGIQTGRPNIRVGAKIPFAIKYGIGATALAHPMHNVVE